MNDINLDDLLGAFTFDAVKASVAPLTFEDLQALSPEERVFSEDFLKRRLAAENFDILIVHYKLGISLIDQNDEVMTTFSTEDATLEGEFKGTFGQLALKNKKSLYTSIVEQIILNIVKEGFMRHTTEAVFDQILSLTGLDKSIVEEAFNQGVSAEEFVQQNLESFTLDHSSPEFKKLIEFLGKAKKYMEGIVEANSYVNLVQFLESSGLYMKLKNPTVLVGLQNKVEKFTFEL